MTKLTINGDDHGGVLQTVQRLYAGYLGKDPDTMVADMSDDVEIRFLGDRRFVGREAARQFFSQNNSLFSELRFDISEIIVDGEYAAAIWTEEATTADGRPWSNHGVDVFHVVDGSVRWLHENNDVVTFRRHFG